MRYFARLNAVSAALALLPFVAGELLVNVSRLARVTGYDIAVVNRTVWWVIAGLSIAALPLAFLILWRCLPRRWANFWSILLWFPYNLIYIVVFVQIVPPGPPDEAPTPAVGLIIIAYEILYTIALILINVLAATTPRTPVKWLRRRLRRLGLAK